MDSRSVNGISDELHCSQFSVMQKARLKSYIFPVMHDLELCFWMEHM